MAVSTGVAGWDEEPRMQWILLERLTDGPAQGGVRGTQWRWLARSSGVVSSPGDGAGVMAEAADARVAVVILTCNQREKTLLCLASLTRVEAPSFEVLLWDNGSQDGTVEAVAERFPTVLVHHHPENLGVASGRNSGAMLAMERLHPSHLLFLDNDMIVTPNFVSALLEPCVNDREGRLVQTQAKLRFLRDPERLNDGGGCRIQFWLGRTVPVGYGEIDRGQYDRPTPCVACGGAMLVRSDVFRELEGFDPRFDPFGPEDLDFSLRLQKAGYRALYVPDALAFHEVSHSFEGGGYSEVYARHKIRNWFAFMWRHAPWIEKVGFLLIGAPLAGLRLVFREGRKGNLGALRGLVRGLLDVLVVRARS